MNNLDGQLLYDLTLKSSFTLKDSVKSPYALVIDGWTEKALHFARNRLPFLGDPQTATEKSLPLICHVMRSSPDGPRYILILTKSEGIVFSEENGFVDPVWKFDVTFDNDPSMENNFYVLPINDSGSVVVLTDPLNHQSYIVDLMAKKCNELTFDFSNSGQIVGFWNLPTTFMNEKALLVLCSFGDWKVFSLSTMRTVLFGKIDGCPVLTSAAFLPKYWLILGGYSPGNFSLSDSKKGESGHAVCFTTYRLTSNSPYVKADENSQLVGKPSLTSRFAFFRQNRPNAPLRMAVSPSQSSLCVLHEAGVVSIWSLPALKLRNVFIPSLQRNFSQSDPHNSSANYSRMLSQIYWWNDECLALLFLDGAFTVCRAEDMNSIIGESAEWFEPSSVMGLIPQDASFIVQKQPHAFPSGIENDPASATAHDLSIIPVTGMVAFLKSLLAYIYPKTSQAVLANEGGAPQSTALELWSFQRVTPEELFEIKLENEEYGDALILARAYNFDTDLIHLRRWKKEPVSHASIEDFLAKIANKRTAINECISRVAETNDGEREMLDFGRHLTNPGESFEEGTDGGPEFLSRFLEEANKNVVDTMASFKTEQAEILLWHFRILEFSKRLELYESLLMKNNSLRYDPQVYGHIRDRDIFELAIEGARSGDVKLTEIIFAYYLPLLEPFRLLIVSNFPETLSPNDYVQLLPGRVVKTVKTEFDAVLNTDFARQMLLGQPKYKPAAIEALLSEAPQLAPFVPALKEGGSFSDQFTPELLTKWFTFRAEEIESDSWHFENAINLLGFGKDAGVSGLDDLFVDLKILSLLVYSCGLKTFSLGALRTSQPIDILKFLLANSRKASNSPQIMEKHIKIWFQPYADLLESKLSSRSTFESIFVKFLAEIVRNDHEFVITVLRLCSRKESRLLIEPVSLLSAAVESVFGCSDPEAIPVFEQILSYLPFRKQADDLEVLKRHNEIDRIKILIENSKILSKYGLAFTVAELRDIGDDSNKCRNLLNQMMIHILRTATKDRSSNFFWTCVLTDGLKLVDSFHDSEVTKDDWLTIYARHLLMFGGPSSAGSGVARLGKLIDGGSLANIAKNVLTFSHAQVSDKQHGSPSLSYAKSARLAVSVARELFESAADLDDSALNRAQLCLDLIPKQYVAIDDELGLAFNEIQRYLECCDFMRQLYAPIVPLSLKVSGDRLGMLTNVISSSSENCLSKNTVFLRLAELLEVAENKTESRNLGLKLLANCAIRAGNLDAALSYCEQIVAANFALAWQECALLCELKVGDESGVAVSDPSRLFPLLAFSLAHCDSPSRMRSLTSVRQRIVADHCLITLQPPAEELAGKVVNKVVTTVAKEIGGRTKQATSLLFSNRFQPIVSLLTEQRKKHHEPNQQQHQVSPHLDSFSSHDVSYVKKFICSYDSASDVALMLRLACISASERPLDADNTELERQINKIGKDLLSDYVEEDLAFAIVECFCSALSSGDPTILTFLLDVLSPNTWPPVDAKVSVLCALVIGLFIEKFYNNKEANACLLQAAPVSIISNVYAQLSGEQAESELEKVGILGQRFMSVIEMLFKMDESQSISRQLPPGINVDLFFTDESYRKQTIFTMASENFGVAMQMAERYEVPVDNVRLRFAQHSIIHANLDDDGEVVASEVVAALTPIIASENSESSKKQLLANFLKNEILAKLSGKNYNRIKFFFKIVDALSGDDSNNTDLTVNLPQNGSAIAKLLCDNSVCFENVDFHEVTKSPSEEQLWQLIDGLADDSSLANVVQLVELLPLKITLNASAIYRRWSVKKFMMAVSELQPVDANSIATAANSVDAYFVHLTPKDFAAFMFDIYSSDPFVKQVVPSSAKQALLKRFLQSLKVAKAKQVKEKGGTVSPPDYSAAQDAFRVLARHLDRLNAANWIQFELVVDSAIYSEIRIDFDRTLSREPAVTAFVSDWLSRLPVSGLGPEVVELFLTCVEFRSKVVVDAYSVCFRHLLSANADPSPLVLAVSKWSKMSGKSSLVNEIYSSFREIVFAVIVHGEGDIVDAGLTPKQRLQLLHRILDASSGQLNLSRSMLVDTDFVFLQIDACLQEKNFNVSRQDLEDESSRARLLTRVSKELSWQAVVELVKVLPPFEDAIIQGEKLIPMLKQAATDAANSQDKNAEVSNYSCLIRELFTDKRINAQQLMEIADLVASLGFHQFAIIICLISSLARDSPEIYEYLSTVEPSTMNMRQQLLCSELLDAGLLPKFAQTPYFVPLVDYAVNNQATMSFSVTQLIDQLASFGLDEEVEFVRKRAAARGRFDPTASSDEPGNSSSLLGSVVSGALRRWF